MISLPAAKGSRAGGWGGSRAEKRDNLKRQKCQLKAKKIEINILLFLFSPHIQSFNSIRFIAHSMGLGSVGT